jgi:hypothetical protein
VFIATLTKIHKLKNIITEAITDVTPDGGFTSGKRYQCDVYLAAWNVGVATEKL